MMNSNFRTIVCTLVCAIVLTSCMRPKGIDPVPVHLSGVFEYEYDAPEALPLVLTHEIRASGFPNVVKQSVLVGETEIVSDGSWSFSGMLCQNVSVSSPEAYFSIYGLRPENLENISVRGDSYSWEMDPEKVTTEYRDGTLYISNIVMKQIDRPHDGYKDIFESESLSQKIPAEGYCNPGY